MLHTNSKNQRYDAVDILRGMVIVLMGLDHVRDFFSPYHYSPDDLDATSPALFFTRWVTHFCAPIFIFLAGMSAFFYRQKGHTKEETSYYLFTRGIWLIFIELTLINLSWGFRFSPAIFVQVIWVIGWSMIILAGLIHLRVTTMAVICAAMVLGHNLFDGISAEDMQSFGWLWSLLHQQSWIHLNADGLGIYVVYPLVPWAGIMSLGYCFAHWVMQEPQRFSHNCLRLGLYLVLAFIALRLTNVYGDSAPWQPQDRGVIFTVLSFLNVSKYPPSLLYTLMTIGPGLIVLGLLHRYRWSGWGVLKTFGRVPFFYYVVHIPVIHALAIVYFSSLPGTYIGWQLDRLVGASNQLPEDYKPNMARIYVAWLLISALLYALCRAYARFKQGRTSWVFRYL